MPVTFLGVGAQKCASSWLHDILADHPSVAVSAVKELDFFSHHYENGLRWYEAQFALRPRRLVCGETSPSYFHEPAAAERAYAYNPRLKIFASLRDPVERALSQHRHMAMLGLLPEDDLSFESALATNPTYVDRGRYHHHLTRWFNLFGREQVHVVLHDDISADSRAVATRLYMFLGIDTDHVSTALYKRSNPSYLARSRQLEGTIRTLRDAMLRFGLGDAWQAFGNLGVRNAYRSINRQTGAAAMPPPRPETLATMRGLFAPEIERLSDLIDRDLSPWLHGR